MAANDGDSTVSRRKIMKALSAAAAGGLAGCGSGGGGDGGDGGDGGGDGGDGGDGGGDGGDGGGSTPTAQAGQAGERVPTLVYEYWTDTGTRTAIHESDIPIMNRNFESIGIDAEVRPESFSTQVAHTFADARHMHYILWGHSHAPDRLDPTEFHFRFNALWAGDNGRGNPSQYANCEHTLAADSVRRVAGEERRQAALQAQQIMSEEVNCIPITPAVRYGGFNTQAVAPGGMGKMKLMGASWRPYVATEGKTTDRIIINHLPVFGESKNYQVINDAALIFAWSNIFYSPLVSYDENFEMTNVLAENIEVNTEATRFEITLKDDIQFTNGDEITAEDVRWTIEDFIRANADELPKLQKIPIQSSEVVDEKTVIFETKTPFPVFITRNMPRQGIQHKETAKAAGAEENPRSFMSNMEPVVGSGILKIENFQQGQLISTVPNEGHPTPPNLPVEFRIFDNVQAAFRQYQNGNMNMIQFLSPTIARERLPNMDNTQTLAANGFMHDVVFYPQHSWSPGQFTEFNAAVGWAMDAQKMAQVGQFGDAEPHNYSITIPPNHPWYPTKIGGSLDDFRRIRNEDGSANPEKAKQLLRDNGWTFDDNDRLRYPGDKDISPQWPNGQQPSDFTDQWPCTQEITR